MSICPKDFPETTFSIGGATGEIVLFLDEFLNEVLPDKDSSKAIYTGDSNEKNKKVCIYHVEIDLIGSVYVTFRKSAKMMTYPYLESERHLF